MSVANDQILIAVVTVVAGGGLTLSGLFISDRLTRRRKQTELKADLSGDLLVSRLHVTQTRREIRFTEINLESSQRRRDLLQMVVPRPPNYQQAFDHETDQTNYLLDRADKSKDRAIDAYAELLRLIEKVKHVFRDNRRIRDKCNEIIYLPLPDPAVMDENLVNTFDKIESWNKSEKIRVQQGIDNGFTVRMDEVIDLVSKQLEAAKAPKVKQKTRIESFCVGILATLRNTFRD